MKSCPHCHQPITEWVIYRHRFTNNRVKACLTSNQVVLASGLQISQRLFLAWFEPAETI